MTDVVASQPNPFVGPRSFRTGEALYGRERETRKLVNLVIAERIVLLHAPSGAGKTSLIQAAVVPQLRERGFEVLPTIRLNAAPQPGANRYVWSTLLALEEQRGPTERIAQGELAALSLSEYLDHRLADADSDALLVFDQFEEVLTLDPVDREAKQAFFRQLGAALEDRRRWALFSVRGDRLSELEPYARPIPTQFATRFPLELLGPRAAREAIQRPAEAQGVSFTNAAAERLIADLSRVHVQHADGSSEDLPGDVVEPVQLQVVCYRLWERIPPGAHEIGEGDIVTVGDVDAALGNYYSERVAAIAADTGIAERAIRDWCENQLIAEGDVRGQVLRGRDESNGLGNAAIQRLVDTHLVRADSRRGAVWYELAHDRLIAPIHKSNAAWREANLSPLQRAAALWEAQDRPEGLLLTESVQEIEQAARSISDLTDTEAQFVALSRVRAERTEQERRQNQRIRWLAAGALFGALVASVLALLSLNYARDANEQRVEVQKQATSVALQRAEAEKQRAEAQRQSRIAELSNLVVQASNNYEARPQLGLLLAAEVSGRRITETESLSGTGDMDARELLRKGLTTIGGTPLGSLGYGATAAAYSPDARLLAVAAGPTVRLWDRFSPKAKPQSFDYPAGDTRALAFSPNGRWLAVAFSDGRVGLWPVDDDDHLGSEQVLQGHTARINAIAFHPQSTWLATASDDKTVRLWDLRLPNDVRSPQPPLGHNAAVSSVLFSADGRQLVSSSENVQIWSFASDGPTGDPRTFAAQDSRSGDVNGLYGVALSPDGRWLVAARAGQGLLIWDLMQANPQSRILDGSEWLTVARFSPNSRWFVLPGPVTKVRDLSTGDPMIQEPAQLIANAFIGAASTFSPDTHWLVTAGNDRIVRIWNMRNLAEPARLLRGHEAGITAVAFNSDGTHLASADATGAVREWEVPFFAADPVVLSGPAQSQGIHTWQIAPGEPPRPQRLLVNEGTNYGIAVSHDGRWAATLNNNADLRIWDLQHPSASPIPLPGYYWAMPIFDPQGRWLIGADTDGKVHLWSLAGRNVGTIVAEWQAHEGGAVRDIDISADGQRLATAGNGDGQAKVWFLGGALSPPQSVAFSAGGGLSYTIRAVAISPDGARVITGSWENDYAARVWSVADPAQAPVELKFKDRVFDVAFSLDGRWAAAASWDNTVGLFDLQSSVPKPIPLTGFSARVLSLDFSPDGHWLAAASEDRAVRLWNLNLRDPSIPQIVLDGPYKIGYIQFSPDGRWLLTEAGEYQSRHFDASGHFLITGFEETDLYHMDAAELRALACRAAGRNLTPDEWQRYLGGGQKTAPRQTCPSLVAQDDGQLEATETALSRAFTAMNSGRFEEALALFDQVRAQNPERLAVPPATLALQAALALAQNGDGAAALRAFTFLDTRDPSLLTAENWNTLCWRGGLFGHAPDVLLACDRAVALAPNNGGIRDSRGLARALAGDTAGAIEDFEAFTRWAPDNGLENFVPARTAWIATLRAGGNPFDAATLFELRQNP